jgi:hypothetical protein
MKRGIFRRRRTRNVRQRSMVGAAIEPLENRQLLSCTINLAVMGGGKTATATSVGQVITLVAFADVSSTEAGTTDGFQETTGSFLSAATASGAVAGNLSASLEPTFINNGSQAGTVQDLNADGNLDVGSNTNSDIAGFFNARAASMITSAYSGAGVSVSGDTFQVPIGLITYTVTSLNSGKPTDINFRVRDIDASAYEAVWQENGSGVNDTTGQLLIGTPVVISAGTVVAPTGSIAGTVTAGGKALSGVEVYIDANNSGSPTASDLTTSTTSTGAYSFTGLAAGTYVVREVTPTGYTQTSPTGANTVSLTTNQAATGENFVDSPVSTSTASISGSVNKVVNGVTSVFSGVEVYLDLTDSGTLASSDPTTTTGSSGTYSFSNLAAGTYHVREVVPSGYTQTSPSGAISTTVTSGQAAALTAFVDTAAATVTYNQYTGTVFGTAGSYNNGGNTIAKAVDGNLTTYFDGPTANGDIVGLDLGSAQTIAQIKYASRSGWAARMNGGVFQASNSSTFSTGVVTLYTVGASENPSSTSLTTQTVTSVATGTYRYVRYVAPAGSFGDIAEFQVFGPGTTMPVANQYTGTVFGTAGSYNNDGNTIAKAVDGSLSTYFDGPTGNGNIVGIDLGSALTITQIKYASRSGWAARMNGGVFQASNSAGFSSGVVTLYTVGASENPSSTSLTTQTISLSTAYRYVRYVAPNGSFGDISEFQVFGPGTTKGKLTGTVFGTSGSYNNYGNTIANAVDNSLTTYFDGPTANGNIVGLNFGSATTISTISYTARSGFESRMVGGYFQASNSSTFASGNVTLYTITAAPAAGQSVTVSTGVSGTYQYVRYVSPAGSFGDIADMSFYS